MTRIWIDGSDDNSFDSGGDNGSGARWGSPVGGTRFESDIERRARRVPAMFIRFAEGLNFRMRQARAPMPSTRDDLGIFHQDRTDHGIRGGRAIAPAGKTQSQAHESGTRHGGYLNARTQKPESDFPFGRATP